MHKRFLQKTGHLLLVRMSWPLEESRFFSAMLSALASSGLKVAAFFAPPGIRPAEASFFVPDSQMELLLCFYQKLRCLTGVPVQISITEKTLLEGSGWKIEQIQALFCNASEGRKLFYQSQNAFVACCDSWDEKMVLEMLQEKEQGGF